MTYIEPIRLEPGDEAALSALPAMASGRGTAHRGHTLHAGHAVLGVREGDVLRRFTRYRQPASDAATDCERRDGGIR